MEKGVCLQKVLDMSGIAGLGGVNFSLGYVAFILNVKFKGLCRASCISSKLYSLINLL
jgi:hypothetical protein